MVESNPVDLRDHERALLRFPLVVTEELRRGGQALAGGLDAEQLQQWAGLGVTIAHRTVRGWEAAAEYFHSSPQVSQALPFHQLLKWAEWGVVLCEHSPALSASYFRATPGVVGRLNFHLLEQWNRLGLSLYQGTWKSGSLAARFFEASPTLLDTLEFTELQRFASFVATLSQRSSELAVESLTLLPQVLSALEKDCNAFLGLATALAETNWRELRSYFNGVGRALRRVDKNHRVRYLVLAEFLTRGGMTNIAGFLERSSEALGQVELSQHGHLLSLAEVLTRYDNAVVLEFLRATPQVLKRISLNRMELWFQEGVRVLQQNPEGGMSYFRLESARSTETLDLLSSGIELDRVKEVVRLYCRALTGSPIEIQPARNLVNKSIGWSAERAPTTEGTQVFLPEVVDRYHTKVDNFQWFKVAATHQVGHLEFSSFAFEFDRPSTLYRDLRPKLDKERERLLKERLPRQQTSPQRGSEKTAEHGWLTDMERFFDLFDDRKMALDVFTVTEDCRVDARIQFEYPGLRRQYHQIQRDTLADRGAIEELPAREALVEFLVRLSLQQYRGLPAPEQYVKEARAIARLAARLRTPTSTVEDSAEVTLRIYAIISRIPNQQVAAQDWQNLDPEQPEDPDHDPLDDLDDDELAELMRMLTGELSQEQSVEGEAVQLYESPPDVEFRGEFKPELTQLLATLREDQQAKAQGPASAQPMTREELEQHLAKNPEIQAIQGDIRHAAGLFANNLLRETGLLNSDPALGYGHPDRQEEEGGPLEATEPGAYLYDEWDFRSGDYKPRWCMVRERAMAEGTTQFYKETVESYHSLVRQVRRQFEMMVPEIFRKIKPLPDGEDIDLDSAIAAYIDRHSGNPPSDKLYWRRNKVERDVAVVFLLDMSASTAEAIEEARRVGDDWDAPPNDPVEHIQWLRMRRGEGSRRPHKRIIDVEKESIVLLINALEGVGDQYGIYGFSGYGRENIEFYSIKDIAEKFSEQVMKRIDKISPLQATRMGPAIRHASEKLATQPARTKLLFLVSDGRPQDRGYSREGVEKEYAVHDTRMALREAHRRDITPFCLTVDRQGHDYLKTMCQDMGYEVLADINALPQRLPMLYRRLTF